MKYFHETFHLFFSAFMGYYRLTYSKGFQLVSKHIWILFALRNIKKYNNKQWENILFLLKNIHSFLFLLCPNNTLFLTQTHSNILHTHFSHTQMLKIQFIWFCLNHNSVQWKRNRMKENKPVKLQYSYNKYNTRNVRTT